MTSTLAQKSNCYFSFTFIPFFFLCQTNFNLYFLDVFQPRCSANGKHCSSKEFLSTKTRLATFSLLCVQLIKLHVFIVNREI